MIKTMSRSDQVSEVSTTPYDGCGKCFVAVRRLSRKTEKTNSPARQAAQIVAMVTAFGGHVIGWADDIEVSGATDPRTRAGFGPWLRGEMGPYDGIAGAAVDRIGRNVRDVLNTAYTNHELGRSLLTDDHSGAWDLDNSDEEQELLIRAMGAQLEHRSIKRRNQEETARARSAGQKKAAPAYGFEYVRITPNGRVDHQRLNKIASENIRDVANRILTDETGMVTTATEASRLNRGQVLSPLDHRRVMYGRQPKGSRWNSKSLEQILTSEASLGYLMHKGKPVLGSDGHPMKLSEGLWSRETRDALVLKTAPHRQRKGVKAPRKTYLLTKIAFCGVCKERLYFAGSAAAPRWACTARVRGVATSQHCSPAPSTDMARLDAEAERWLVERHGSAQVMERRFVPGTSYAARITELEADRRRLRDDRKAGLYDEPDDAVWYQTEYMRMGNEIRDLRRLPEQPAGMRLVSTGKTVLQEWQSAEDGAARRLMLAGFSVRIELFPEGAAERIKITGANPYAVAT